MLIKSTFKTTYLLLYFLLLLFIVGAAIYFTITIALNDYWDIGQLFVLLIFLVAGFFTLRHILGMRNVIIDDKKLVLIDLRGDIKKEILYDSIISITEQIKTGKNNRISHLLILDIGDKKIKLLEDAYHNYDEIKQALGTKLKTDIPTVEETSGRIGIVIFLIFLAGIILFESLSQRSGDLVQFNFSQNEKPYIHRYKSGRTTDYDIIFSIDKYPGFTFRINGDAYKNMDKELYLSTVNVGDTLTAFILKDDYETKLVKTRDPDFLTKHSNYETIKIYGLTKGEDVYLDNEKEKLDMPVKKGENRFRIILFIGAALIIGLAVLYKRLNANM